MITKTIFADVSSHEHKQRERVSTLLVNAQELYTHLNDILIHEIKDDGTLTLTRDDVQALVETMRRFSLR